MKAQQFTARLELDGIKLMVSGKYIPGDPGRWSYSNGDPGYPGTSAEVELDPDETIVGEDDWNILLLYYRNSEDAIYRAIEDIILDNPDKYIE